MTTTFTDTRLILALASCGLRALGKSVESHTHPRLSSNALSESVQPALHDAVCNSVTLWWSKILSSSAESK